MGFLTRAARPAASHPSPALPSPLKPRPSLRPGETVWYLNYEMPAVVIRVDAVRGRAEVSLAGGYSRIDGSPVPARAWENLSMLLPLARTEERDAKPEQPLSLFLAECCSSGGWAASTSLRQVYLHWCEEQQVFPLSWTGLSNALLAMGLTPGMRWIGPAGRRVKVRVWQGIELRAVELG